MQFNKIILIGRLTRDPELRSTSTGKNVTKFGLAVNKRFKPRDSDGPDADFFDVSAWGQSADYVNQYAGKGRLVVVEGRIESRKYTDRDGNEKTAWEVTADNVTLLDRPRDDDGGGSRSYDGGRPARSADPGQAPSAGAPSRGVTPGEGDYDPFADA